MDPLLDNLGWLKSPVQYAKGIGPYLSKLFERLGVATFEDLLYHLPFRYLDRRSIAQIAKTQPGKQRVIYGEVDAVGEIMLGKRGRKVFEVIVTDGHGYLTAKWFHYPRKFFQERFKKGEKFLFFGEVSLFRNEKQMVHPEVTPVKEFFDEEDFQKHLGIVPVYSTTEGLHQRQIRKALDSLLEGLSDRLGETLTPELERQYQLPALGESFQRIHRPLDEDSLEIWSAQRSPFHRRLVFEEFFYLQLGLAFRRQKAKVLSGIAHQPRFRLREALLNKLPFKLTSGQERAILEITRDMCAPRPMNRLLQGDVGSGKTLVAMVAALLAVENGRQAVVMAPTEILAEQHYRNFGKLLEGMDIPVRILTASTKGAERREVLDLLRTGVSGIVVGTHALLEEEVEFERLSLVVIDEQHRFGVRQRMSLMKKSEQPDVLVMTATPIPRSLAMTLYGDLDLSLMTEMPPGRIPILTRIMYEKDRPKLYQFVREKVAAGQQAYFVFPLIEESEKLDLKDATKAFEKLKEIFKEFKIDMLHGRMKNLQKEEVMKRFAAGETQILVSTTVIEVGIDVPNATMMVIEHAERFGLSQLHQLRGRVGRGGQKSYCILATDFKQSDLAKERLEQDPELRQEAHLRIRPILEHRWKGRLSLAQVG
ncbi:MAG: ATP-dependent DNA helicase RecG [Deltaproteobacteria bacterium]|nr:ATP-dependent DNA helicase RecG [Deltaproteobacteria bacterium]